MDQPHSTKITDSKLSGMKLNKAILRDCELRSIEISRSSIYNCTVDDAQLINCVLYNCKLSSSKSNGVQMVNCDIKNCQFVRPRPTLYRLPPEIREIIFRYTLEWKGKAPALIVALRGHEELYQHALAVLSAHNAFVLSSANIAYAAQPLGYMSWKAFEGIQKVHVKVDKEKTGICRKAFFEGGTFSEVLLSFDQELDFGFDVADFVRVILESCIRLKEIRVSYIETPKRQMEYPLDIISHFEIAEKYINLHTEIEGELIESIATRNNARKNTWRWKAENDRGLYWYPLDQLYESEEMSGPAPFGEV